MLLYFLRHGDPIYHPDSLTPRGQLQAQALAKRLARYGLDELYASPMVRAQQTAAPTAELLQKEIVTLDWTSEDLIWADFSIHDRDGKRRMIQYSSRLAELRRASVTARGARWHEDDLFSDVNASAGFARVQRESDAFLAAHGYEHDPENGRYIVRAANDKRIAVFCHASFGRAWLAAMLDIPLPAAWATMDIGHSSMTVVEFADEGGLCLPKLLTMCSDAHLYAEGLPTKYNNRVYF